MLERRNIDKYDRAADGYYSPEQMENIITEKLRLLEAEHGIQILLAVESGSRAWGFASHDSDYDVRFIYVHSPQWYFSVGHQKDTIEYISDDHLLDFSGWELRKALQLLAKTNPNLSDWLLTDMIYNVNEVFLNEIRKAQAHFYNPINGMYHFFNIAKRHDEGYLQRNGCTLKKFLYFLRGVLACEYIEMNKHHPPVEFRKLVNATVNDTVLKASINCLLDLKARSKESDTLIVDKALQSFAFTHYKDVERKLGQFKPATNQRHWSELDSLLYRFASGVDASGAS